MLDRMERLARSGAKDAAKQLLDQLRPMLDNLQMAQPNGDQGDGDDMQQALDELGDMIRQQQQLRDRTFRQGQDQRRQQRGSRASAASRATATRWASCARTSRRCASSSTSCWRR